MIITDPNQIDLTGQAKQYKRNLRRFKVFTANQLIDLKDTAYLNSIEVYKVTGFDSSNEPILESMSGRWYTEEDTCYDITAMAKAKSRAGYNPPTYSLTTDTTFQSGKNYYIKNGSIYTKATVITGSTIPSGSGQTQYYEMSQITWDHILVNKLYIDDTVDEISINGEYEIAISYNGLEIECSAISQDGIGPEYSPGLMRSVLDKVEELFYVRNPITNTFATTIDSIHCLFEDLTGHKRENYISNEIHAVTSAMNLVVIRPQCGSFYNTNTLELKFQSNDLNAAVVPLTKDVDYVVTGLNKEKTSISEPSCGVYEYIVIKRSLVGKILVSYQAFGGEVTQADINTIKEALQNVYRIVNATDIVTAANIESTSIVRSLVTRQDLLEHTIGHYQAQRFSYETSSSDKWANIAFIDKNPWTADAPVPTSCIGEFRVKIPDMYFFMDLKISFDINATNDKQILNVSVYHQETPTFDKNILDYFIKRVVPKFRIIWISTKNSGDVVDSANKGIMLQMSVTSQEPTTVSVIVEDMTGVRSPWYLVDTLGDIRPNGYTNTSLDYGERIELDNSSSPQYEFMWRSNTDKKSNSISLYPQGYTIFAGNIPIEDIEKLSINHSDPEFGDIPEQLSTGYSVDPIITGSDIDLESVKSVEFIVFDRVDGKYLSGRSSKIYCKNNVLFADALYFLDDLCLLSCTLEHNNQIYSMKLYSKTGTNSLSSHRFDLVRIDLIS